MDYLIGQNLHNRYSIQTLLGRKTGRRTFLATDLQARSPVVIKLLLFGPDFTWDDLKLFEREAETLKSLDHPAIPRYLDSFEVATELGKGFALVQSYIKARSLQCRIQSGRTFSEAELEVIARELLELLHYLHSRQPPVIHRDIKPSNILLGDRSGNYVGQVYLVDFGSVQNTFAREEGTFTVVGTYGYMPFEQFSGRSIPASDLYSLGATLLYLATGKHPADFSQKDLRLEFAPFVQLSSPLTQWLTQMIEPSLEQRFHSAKDAIDALTSLHQPHSSVTARQSLTPDSREAPASCRKHLVTKTSETFHWVVSARHKWRDALADLFDPVRNVDGCFLQALIVIMMVSSLSIPLAALGALFASAIAGNWISIGFVTLIGLGGTSWVVQHFHEFLELFSETHFKVDYERILITHHLLGMRWHTLNSPRQWVQKLCFVPRHFELSEPDDYGKVHSREVKAKLELWINHQKYRIPGTYSFNESELEWLGQELSAWLGRELKVLPTAATPK